MQCSLRYGFVLLGMFLLRARYGDRYKVFSAGTEATEVRPLAAEVMQELGIDLSDHTSKTLEAFDDRRFDVVVTVCDDAREVCPHLPAPKTNLHEGFEDPSAATGTEEERRAAFRRVRDALADWIGETFRGEAPLSQS